MVEVDKSSGSLGLTLEGGSDMGSDVKIKSIKVRLTGDVWSGDIDRSRELISF